MLPTIRRISSILLNNNNTNTDDEDVSRKNNELVQTTERLGNKSSDSSSKSTEDFNNVYIETLLYIVHVDDIDLPISTNHNITEEISQILEEQQLTSSENVLKHRSKRTTASFNQRHQTSKLPLYRRPSINFCSPLRHLNSSIKIAENPLQPKSNIRRSSSSTDQSCLKNQANANKIYEEKFPAPLSPLLHVNPIKDTQKSSVIRAFGPGLEDGFVNDNCYFDLDAPYVELQKLVIAIDGPSKADIHIEIIDTNVYRVFYICKTPGSYHISITYDGEQITDSPYHLHLRSQPLQEQVVPPVLPPPIKSLHAVITPIEFYVNTSCIVRVRPAIPCTVFQAYIQAPQKNINLPITVHKSAKSESYEIYFVPNICGSHWLHVSFNHVPVSDNPHRLIVRSSSSAKSTTKTVQDLFHAYKGETSQFFISKSPNDPSLGKGDFTIGISGPSKNFLHATETDYGYEFHYKPTLSGKYIITIKDNGRHIQGSPFIYHVSDTLNESHTFSSTIYEKESDIENETTTCTTIQTKTTSSNSLIPVSSISNPIRSSTRSTTHVDLDILRSSMIGDASQVCVFGSGLYETKPRRKATFRIDTSKAGPGLLLVGLYSSLGSYERLAVKRIMSLSPAYIYKVSYRVQIRGQYMLVILYGSSMQHVPGSPYLITVE